MSRQPWRFAGLAAVIAAAGLTGRVGAATQQSDRPALNVAGHVVTPDQNPIRRARVRIAGKVAIETDTDTDGNFGAKGLPAGSYSVEVLKTGFVQLAPATIDLPVLPSTITTITMQRGAVITGRVLYESGVPAPDTAVSLTESPSVPFRLITTDDRGVFRFHSLRPGAYILCAPGVYYPSAPDESRAEPIRVGVGETVDVQLVMPAASVAFSAPQIAPLPPDKMATGTSVVIGRLTDAETRAPIAGATVRAMLKGQTQIRSVHTADDGTYALDKLPAGSYQIMATAWGYSAAVYGQRGRAEPWMMVTVGEAEKRSNLAFALVPAKVLTGRVLDEFGDAAPDLKVQAFRASGNGNALVPQTDPDVRTDDTGAFRVPRLEPGAYLLVAYGGELARGGRTGARDDFTRGFAPTFFPGTTSSTAALPIRIDPDKSPAPVALTMIPTPLTAIDGRITDADGKPGPAYVVLIPLYDGQIRVLITTQTSADASGQFVFSNIPPGTYALQALGMGFLQAQGAGMGPGIRGFRNWIVTVGAVERAHVDLALAQPGIASGRLVANEAIPSDVLARARLLPAPIDFMRGSTGGLSNLRTVNPDGTFVADGFLGEIRLNVDLPDPWIVPA
jgi:hypothetical protein